MDSYYSDKLSAERLKRCYEVATPRVQQYLDAELDYVLGKIKSSDVVLELGCGYGRILPALAARARWVTGIDISMSSLDLARQYIQGLSNCRLFRMDASQLSFNDRAFDVVICIQNGISAFHTDRKKLIQESIRVTKCSGTILFSSYSEKFWGHRLEWFRLQSEAGLLGEIDHEKTRDGNIVCKDGFTASTVGPEEFRELTSHFAVKTSIFEIDDSVVFCEMTREEG